MDEFANAIIGLACRFPGAPNVEQYWENLRGGIESIDRTCCTNRPTPVHGEPGYVSARGTLDDIDMFDAQFFGYSPREAQLIDPQQRIFLECAWAALEAAGYGPGIVDKPVGVYASSSISSYLIR